MARQKKVILAVERIHPNTLMSEKGKYIRNFISYEDNAVEAFKAQSQRKIWDEKTSPDVVKNILKERFKPKGGTQFFYDDEIAVWDAKLSDKIKFRDDYIYRFREMETCSIMTEIYISYKELLAILSRKIKNKYACVLYDGNNEKIEYSENEIGNIIARMATETNSIMISQYNKGKCDEYWFEITIYKNMLAQ